MPDIVVKRIPLDRIRERYTLAEGELVSKDGTKVPRYTKSNGYSVVTHQKSNYFEHRLVWALHSGKEIFPRIDHIDGDTKNNSVANLREVTNRENSQNQKRHREGKQVGASPVSYDNRWQVSMMIKGKIYFVGKFDTEEQASEVYKIACCAADKFEDINSFRELVRSRTSFDSGARVGKRFYLNPASNVGFDKARNRWRVQMNLGGKNVMLGRFKDKEQALEFARTASLIRDSFVDRRSFIKAIQDHVE